MTVDEIFGTHRERRAWTYFAAELLRPADRVGR